MELNLDIMLVAAVVGVACGWLARYLINKARRRKTHGCAGGCGCSTKITPKQ